MCLKGKPKYLSRHLACITHVALETAALLLTLQHHNVHAAEFLIAHMNRLKTQVTQARTCL